MSAGCQNCYAMKQAHRFSGEGKAYEGLTELGPQGPRWTGKVRLVPDLLNAPMRWKKPCRIFVNSMSDLFHEDVPEEFITAVFGVMLTRPDHIFQILTKRPRRMLEYLTGIRMLGGLGPYIRSVRIDGDRTLPNFFNAVMKTAVYRGRRHRAMGDPWMSVFNAAACNMNNKPLSNVWLGVSVEDQQTADERIPILLQTPAAVRWVSAEPLLGPIDLSPWLYDHRECTCCEVIGGGHQMGCMFYGEGKKFINASPDLLDWVVTGAESGPRARQMNEDWVRSLRDQCQSARIAFFYKQNAIRGKKIGTPQLDGHRWTEYPR